MQKKQLTGILVGALGALGLAACASNTSTDSADVRGDRPTMVGGGHLTGAIFTTTEDGSRVNANIYSAKEDVYLDGGPRQNAPARAAALPEGDYYFQVTDPSGKTLLSTDDISCRSFHVSSDGVIVYVNRGMGGCEHLTGIDQDHAALGAITVQLAPYDDTPNKGFEYKAWATPVDDYNPDYDRTHGFVPRFSKTDNFKVKANAMGPVCGNGIVEAGEQCDDGNTVNGDGCSSTCQLENPPAVCGNGILEAGEQCDDGNTVNGDGCSSTCQIETPPPVCGNGIVEAGEQCDEGAANGQPGSDCSATCQCIPM